MGNRQTATRGLFASVTTTDSRNRVTSVTEPVGTTTYAYDAASRRTGQTGPGLSVDTTYDSRGLPVQQTATASGLAPTTTTSSREFDGDGNLVSVTASGSTGTAVTRDLLWDVAAPIPQVLSLDDGATNADVVYGMGRAMAIRSTPLGTRASSPVATVFSRDVFGSNATTPATADLVRSTGYDDFGQPAPEAAAASTISGSQAVAAATSVPGQLPTFGYRGELHMGAEVHLRARQLDPANGIFTTRDPSGTPAGDDTTTHRFAYAANNPVHNVDPRGLSPYGDAEYWSAWRTATWPSGR